MSINKPAIAAGSTQWIARTYGGRIRIVPVVPGNKYLGLDEAGQLTYKTTDPSVEGELIIQQSGTGDSKTMSLYVAVDISGALAWKKASVLEGSDRYTNQQSSVVY